MYLSFLKTKVLFFSACMILLIMTACSGDDDISGNGGGGIVTPNDSLPDYTVIMMMQPGGNDYVTVDDLAEMVALREEGKIGDNVNVIGIIRPTAEYQIKGETDCCFRFELKKKQGYSADTIKALHDMDWLELMNSTNKDQIRDIYKGLFTKFFDCKRICDSSTVINCADTITSLIKNAVVLHPAKHYAFMLYGHGEGYDPIADPTVNGAYTTRACLPDYCIKGEPKLGIDEFMLGIKNSGVKFQTLLTQCCLMATLENMTAYADQFDYFLGSDEVTRGNYFPRFVQDLSEAGDDETKLKAGLTDLVDFYGTLSEDILELIPVATSYGYYDLKKMPQLLSAVKQASDWFMEANQKDTLFMRDVILNTYYTLDNDAGITISQDSLQSIRDFILHPENHSAEITPQQIYDVLYFIANNNSKDIKQNFVFATMLKAALDNKANSKASTGLDFVALQTIYDQYITALKDMAYIKCNKGAAVSQDPYIYASPSVQLVNFNENFYIPSLHLDYGSGFEADIESLSSLSETLFNAYEKGKTDFYNGVISIFYRGNFYAGKYADAILNEDAEAKELYSAKHIADTYCATLFHQKTGWGNLLKQTIYNPNLIFNPYRTVEAPQKEAED